MIVILEYSSTTKECSTQSHYHHRFVVRIATVAQEWGALANKGDSSWSSLSATKIFHLHNPFSLALLLTTKCWVKSHILVRCDDSCVVERLLFIPNPHTRRDCSLSSYSPDTKVTLLTPLHSTQAVSAVDCGLVFVSAQGNGTAQSHPSPHDQTILIPIHKTTLGWCSKTLKKEIIFAPILLSGQ